MKIFVSVGTQDKPFARLLKEIDSSAVQADYLVQCGCTPWVSERMKIQPYFTKEEFNQALETCDILVCHGGVGTLMQGLHLGKKIIAMPRLKKYGEHQNDHQLQIVDSFAQSAYLLKWDEGVSFAEMIEKANCFLAEKVPANQENFIHQLRNYLQREL